MRRKKLDVVFDNSVNEFADQIIEMIRKDIDMRGSNQKVNRSEVMRVAMHLGLKALNDKLITETSEKYPMSTAIKIGGMRASLGFHK